MQAEGLRQVDAAKADGRWDAAYAPPSAIETPAELADALAVNPQASAAFHAMGKSRRYQLVLDIVTKKQAKTRSRKIAELVARLAG